MSAQTHLARAGLYALAIGVSALFLYPYLWMVLSSVRGTEEAMVAPLRLWPERLSFAAYADIARIGGIPLGRFVFNSIVVTVASTIVAVAVTALAAYALNRRPRLPGMRWVRYGFLLTIMYPYMLLLIPVYLVMHQLGLLGSTAGLVLFLSLGPIQFFLFDQFFRAVPRELIEAAQIDGATEWQVLWRIVMPTALPVVATVTLITFLINWAQWFPVIVIASQPQSYTLPAALLMLNTELGVSYQSILAMATITTMPVVVVFLFAQRRVMSGFAAGAVKG